MVIYGTTDKGIKRSANQDSFFAAEIADGLALVAVCDGMGGAAGGSEASTLAAKVFAEECRKFAENSYNSELKCFTVSTEEIGKAMADAAKRANTAVFSAATENEGLHGMGTTLAAAFVTSDILYGVNVGDSRVYLCSNDGSLRRLSKDHSYVQYLVDMGTPEFKSTFLEFVNKKADFEGVNDKTVKGLMKHAGVVKKKMEPER